MSTLYIIGIVCCMMGKGYSIEDIRSRLIPILESEPGMSGVAISEKIGISRITMTKYLKILSAQGLVYSKNMGNIVLWFLESGQESFKFPDDYFKVAKLYQEYLIAADESQLVGLIYNCLNSGAISSRLVTEMILPGVDTINDLFDSGKIGAAEQSLLYGLTNRSLYVVYDYQRVTIDPTKNVSIIAADPESVILSTAAATIYHTRGWRVFDLGDMSFMINPLFDLDFQKLIRKIWKRRSGVMIVVVFSSSSEGLSFFKDSIKPVKIKSGSRLKIVMCGPSTKIKSDLVTEKLDDVIQWSNTVHDNLKTK